MSIPRLRSTVLLALFCLALGAVIFGALDYWSQNQALKKQLSVARSGESSIQANAPLSTANGTGSVPGFRAGDHIDGPANAPVLLVEYSDYDCPFCRQLEPTMKALRTQYGDKMAWVYRQYPLPIHPNAELKSEVGECVAKTADEAAFWRYTTAMFEETQITDRNALLARVAQLGASRPAVEQCLAAGTVQPLITTEKNEALAAGLRGTPTTFLIKKDGTIKMVNGALPLSDFQQLINEALQ